MTAGCAGTMPAAPKEERAATDPWEPLNRRIYYFNDGFDKVTYKPLAKGYEKVIPQFARTGVTNFGKNLRGPMHIINNVLQGKFGRGVVSPRLPVSRNIQKLLARHLPSGAYLMVRMS
jgi:phospholipid-binding lipoprotein MlaA